MHKFHVHVILQEHNPHKCAGITVFHFYRGSGGMMYHSILPEERDLCVCVHICTCIHVCMDAGMS
jgi:hypothetical protein